MALVTAASVADRVGEGDDDGGLMTCPPWKTALTLLMAKSPTIRLRTPMGSLFKQVIEGSSARVLCMLLKADKPAYGIEEAVDTLNCKTQNAIVKIVSQNSLNFNCKMLPLSRMFNPLEISIVCLFRQIHQPLLNDKSRPHCLRQQIAILRLLRDARATVCHTDETFKQFLRLTRNQLDVVNNHHQQNALEFCNQMLHATESDLDKPRTLLEMCRTRVRYELNIRGLGVHHIRDCVSHTVKNYLLYGDLDPEEYTVSLWISHFGFLLLRINNMY